MKCRQQSGQAVLEWIVFGLTGFLVWAAVYELSFKLLNRTLSQSVSLFAARAALSQEVVSPKLFTHADTIVVQSSSERSGSATVTAKAGGLAFRTRSRTLRLPENKKAASRFSSFFFGSPSSSFSE